MCLAFCLSVQLSNFHNAKQILDTNYDYGSIHDIMKIFTAAQNGRTLDTYEKFYFYKYKKIKQILNEQNT